MDGGWCETRSQTQGNSRLNKYSSVSKANKRGAFKLGDSRHDKNVASWEKSYLVPTHCLFRNTTVAISSSWICTLLENKSTGLNEQSLPPSQWCTPSHKTPKGTILVRISLHPSLLRRFIIDDKSVFITLQHECWRKSGAMMEISVFLHYYFFFFTILPDE